MLPTNTSQASFEAGFCMRVMPSAGISACPVNTYATPAQKATQADQQPPTAEGSPEFRRTKRREDGTQTGCKEEENHGETARGTGGGRSNENEGRREGNLVDGQEERSKLEGKTNREDEQSV